MSLLDDLYQEAIMEHYRNPRNHGELPDADVAQEGVNPSCGDELTLYVKASGDALAAVTFVGEGCAISQASASMMTAAVKGKSIGEAERLSLAFQRLIRGEEPGTDLGDLALLRGVAKLPVRVKCAALPWKTLDAALERLRSLGRASGG